MTRWTDDNMDTQLFFRPVFLVPALCVLYLLGSFLRQRTRRLNLPIIGARKGDLFPLLQATWRNTMNVEAAMKEAHGHYRDRAVILPVASAGDLVMLPYSEIDFVSDQPESVLSFMERAFDNYQVDYTFMDPIIPRTTLHGSLLRTTLTPQINILVPALVEEMGWAFEKHWGTDTQRWREVRVNDTTRHVVGSAVHRSFYGLPLCRDAELLDSGMAFAAMVPICAAIINFFWEPLRPLIAPFATIPLRISQRKFRRLLRAEIGERVSGYEARSANPDNKSLGREPSDFLQWFIHQAKDLGDPYMWQSNPVADRMLIVEFAAIFTTAFTLTWTLLDLAAYEPGIVHELREEITSVLAENGGRWSKRVLARLEKLDSTLRESARLNSILAVGLNRVVVADDGMTTPSGVHLPKGTKINVPVYSIMGDESIYPDPQQFKPLRFYEQRHSQGDAGKKRERPDLDTSCPEFLAFGYGKHACPGRFFAAAILKLLLAHVILHYDLEPKPEKPDGLWYGIHCIPPFKTTIRVKRREASF